MFAIFQREELISPIFSPFSLFLKYLPFTRCGLLYSATAMFFFDSKGHCDNAA